MVQQTNNCRVDIQFLLLLLNYKCVRWTKERNNKKKSGDSLKESKQTKRNKTTN